MLRGINSLGRTPVTAGTTFLIDQDCEGTGTPAGWTNSTGSPNWDYSAAPLAGAQSLYLSCAAAAVRGRIDFTNQTEAYYYFLLKLTNGSYPASELVFFVSAPNGSTTFSPTLTLGTTGRLNWSGANPTGTLTIGTMYHIWLHYKQGTGADAVVDLGFSTTGVRPTVAGTDYQQITNSSITALAGRIGCGPTITTLGVDLIFDNIRVAATQIGNNGS